jgi:3-deoxy-7-phosphoheptulonate synthase
MLIVMRQDAAPQEVSAVIDAVERQNLRAHLYRGDERIVIGVVGLVRSAAPGSEAPFVPPVDPSQAAPRLNQELMRQLPGVDRLVPITRPYKLASREFISEKSRFRLGKSQVGGQSVLIIAGPCSVESRSQILEVAQAVQEAGAHALRGGAYKPRTSPYSFQGMGEEGLELLAEAGAKFDLPIVTEVMAPEYVPLVARYAQVLQIGARNMQNFNLLNAAGASQQPVLLKRGPSATIEDLLMSAEYVLSQGNRRVMLCERGIRTFENATRNTTDINAIPVLQGLTHLPILLDPSHSTGEAGFVEAIARAGIAAGADGLMIEVHPNPGEALSDGQQSLTPEQFARLVQAIKAVAQAVGRSVL